MPNKAVDYVSSLALFIGTAVLLCLNFDVLFGDADTAWHLAAGNLIRAKGAIPATDPWSYASQGYPWLNVAWLWDIWMSILHQHFGWHGPVAFFALVYAGTMALLYQACLLRSGSGIASFFTVLLVIFSIPYYLRPMWASNFLLALLFLIALHVRHRGRSPAWWYAMPLLMPLWVNVHGGFIVAFALLGAFGLEALHKRQWKSVAHMSIAGLLSIAALGINPYGYAGVAGIVWDTFTTPALQYITEFQPTVISWYFLFSQPYIPVFFIAVLWRRERTSLAEAILAFGLILLAAQTVRYWTFFYLFSCPLLAQHLAARLGSSTATGNQTAIRIAARLKDVIFVRHARATCAGASLAAAIFIAGLFSPAAVGWLAIKNHRPYAFVEPALHFIQSHYPHARFMTDMVTGGILIGLTDGAFPIFMDGRGSTAYPPSTIVDFIAVRDMKPGWEKVIERHRIDGFILTMNDEAFRSSCQLNGWKLVWRDEAASIYLRP